MSVNSGIEPTADTVGNEATSLSSSQWVATSAAENAEHSDDDDPTSTSAANDTPEEEVVCFYNSVGEKIPKNVTKLIFGKNVIHIAEGAFEGYEFLVEVDMSGALLLKTIGNNAFKACSALALVKWPPNLKTIGDSAFEGCTSLKEADMSELHALETIGSGSFEQCSALALVKCPPNLKTILGRAFFTVIV